MTADPPLSSRHWNGDDLVFTNAVGSPTHPPDQLRRAGDDGLPVITRDRTVAELLELWRTKALPNRDLSPARLAGHDWAIRILTHELGGIKLQAWWTLRPTFVATSPGMIDVTWIGSSTSSSGNVSVMTFTPCFVAPYAPESGRNAATDDTFTTWPVAAPTSACGAARTQAFGDGATDPTRGTGDNGGLGREIGMFGHVVTPPGISCARGLRA